MKSFLASVSWVLAAMACWWLLEDAIPGRSERFYLLLPPTVLGVAWVLSDDSVDWWRTHLRPTLILGGTLTGTAFVFSLILTASRLQLIPCGVLRHMASEVLIAGYFLTALLMVWKLVLEGIRRVVHRALRGRPAAEAELPGSRRRRFLVATLPIALMLPLAKALWVADCPEHGSAFALRQDYLANALRVLPGPARTVVRRPEIRPPGTRNR